MQENISVKIFVKIDGAYSPWEDLSEEMRNEIGRVLNDRAMSSIGYSPIEENKSIDKK
jgi:hypothetical protein